MPTQRSDPRVIRRWTALDWQVPEWPINDAGPSWAAVRPRHGGIGHRHLRSLLRVHHALRRGGVLTAVAMLTLPRITAAVTAYRYFGLDALAELVTRVPDAAASIPSADLFDAEYRAYVATGHGMVDAIRRKIAAQPQDFPVGPI